MFTRNVIDHNQKLQIETLVDVNNTTLVKCQTIEFIMPEPGFADDDISSGFVILDTLREQKNGDNLLPIYREH